MSKCPRYPRLEAPGLGAKDVESGRRKMYEFLDLDPAEALPISGESRTAPGFEKEDPASFWRHGQVGDWRKYANDDFKRWFKAAAGEAFIRMAMAVNGRLGTVALGMGPYLKDVASTLSAHPGVGGYYGVDVNLFRPVPSTDRAAISASP